MADFFWNQAENAFQSVWDKFIAATRGNWGSEQALKQSDKIKKYSRKELKAIKAEADVILAGFAKLRHGLPDRPEALELCAQWRAHITRYYYDCTVPLLEGLGQSYAQQEPLQMDIDRHGIGTARFMSQAIAVYCEEAYKEFELKK